jgi:hypothetical protein
MTEKEKKADALSDGIGAGVVSSVFFSWGVGLANGGIISDYFNSKVGNEDLLIVGALNLAIFGFVAVISQFDASEYKGTRAIAALSTFLTAVTACSWLFYNDFESSYESNTNNSFVEGIHFSNVSKTPNSILVPS